MNNLYFTTDWLGNQNSNRKSILFDEKPTATERCCLKNLLEAVQVRLSDVKDHLRILEETNRQKKQPGPHENDITSFEALLFWFKLFEEKVATYNSKTAVDTEFTPKIRIIQKRIRILSKRSVNTMNCSV